MADPATIGYLGLAGANLVGSAISGGKADQLAQDALRLEQQREADRTVLRDLFMQRILGGAGTPEAALGYGQNTAAGAFRPGGAPGTQNPFERAPTLPSPTTVEPAILDAAQARIRAMDRIDPNWRAPRGSAKFGTSGNPPGTDVPDNSPKFGTTPQQRGLQPEAAGAPEASPRGVAQWVNRLLGGR